MSLIQLVYLWSIIGILHLGNQSYAVPLLSIRTSLACIWFKQYSINATNGGGTMATLAQNHIEITNPILIKNNKYAKHILSHTVKEEVFHSRLKFWYLAYQVGSNHCHLPLKIWFSCLCPPFPSLARTSTFWKVCSSGAAMCGQQTLYESGGDGRRLIWAWPARRQLAELAKRQEKFCPLHIYTNSNTDSSTNTNANTSAQRKIEL